MNDCIPIFIGGEGRSGTSLMRVIIDSHPNIASGPETHLFRDPMFVQTFKHLLENYWERIEEYDPEPVKRMGRAYAAMFHQFFGEYAASKNKTRWADKTPQNILAINFLLIVFDQRVKFIHVIRDGRDVTSSVLGQKWGADNVAAAAESWKRCIDEGRAHRGKQYYIEVQYEALINDFERSLRRIFEFLDEPFTGELLNYFAAEHDLADDSSSHQVVKPPYTSSIGRWKNDLSADDLKVFYGIAGDTLDELGYTDR